MQATICTNKSSPRQPTVSVHCMLNMVVVTWTVFAVRVHSRVHSQGGQQRVVEMETWSHTKG